MTTNSLTRKGMRLMTRIAKRKVLLKKSSSLGYVKPDDWGPKDKEEKAEIKKAEKVEETIAEVKEEVIEDKEEVKEAKKEVKKTTEKVEKPKAKKATKKSDTKEK